MWRGGDVGLATGTERSRAWQSGAVSTRASKPIDAETSDVRRRDVRRPTPSIRAPEQLRRFDTGPRAEADFSARSIADLPLSGVPSLLRFDSVETVESRA